MRRDMAKVVTEKPRRGSGYNNHHRNTVTATRGRVRPNADDLEDITLDAPAHTSRAPRGLKLPYDTKNFTNVIGPTGRIGSFIGSTNNFILEVATAAKRLL